MKIQASTKYNFEIVGLNKGVPHPITQGLRSAVIHTVTLELEVFNEPQFVLDGDSEQYDFKFYGFDCKSNGQPKIQQHYVRISFTRRVHALKFLCKLVAELPDGDAKDTLEQLISADMKRSFEYERKKLERLLQ